MEKGLIKGALLKYFSGLAIIMLLLFLPAGTFGYMNGWLFIGLLFIPMLIVGIVLMLKNPALLEKRLNAKESQSEQKTVLLISGIMFLAGFAGAGLCYRFGFLMLPKWAVLIAAVLFLGSYVMYAEVLRENEYLSRTVEVQQGQKVIDTGLYGVVRHPMYSATVLMFLSIPLVLGSVVSFLIFLIYPFTLVKRIRNEETVLESGLEGYSEYKQRIKYRLIPFIW